MGYERSKTAPWIPYGLNVLLGLGVTFPTGKYDKSEMVNVSANVYDFAPNFALTYVVPSIFGEELGMQLSSARACSTTCTPKTMTRTIKRATWSAWILQFLSDLASGK